MAQFDKVIKFLSNIFVLGILINFQFVQSKQCENVVAGVEKIGRGVDITTLDMFPSDLLLNNLFSNDLFDFSCDLDKKRTNPINQGSENSVPDQIAAINTIPGGALNIKVKLSQDLEEYKTLLAEKIGLQMGRDSFGYFSNSKSYLKAQELMEKLNKSVAEISTFTTAVQIDLKPSSSLKLNDRFTDMISNILPIKYEHDPDLYDEFLDTFGTHYFQSAIVGGYLYQETIIQNDYLFVNDFKEIISNFKTTFVNSAGIVQEDDPEQGVSKFISDIFLSNTESSFYFYGGSTDLATGHGNSHLTQWSVTASQDPWLFGGKLKPIESLIRNSTIKSQVKKAVQIKRAKAYLQEVTNKVKLNGLEDSEHHRASLQSIEDMLNNLQDASFNVVKLVKNIDDLSNEIQLNKNRAYLQEYQQKFAYAIDSVLSCKLNISIQCSSENKEEFIKQNNHIHSLQTQYEEMLAMKQKIRSKQVQKLIQETIKLVEHNEILQLNMCNNDEQCLKCFEQWATKIPQACKNSVFMPLLKNYLPWLNN